MTRTRQGLSSAAIEQLINRCVVDAMAAYEATEMQPKMKLVAVLVTFATCTLLDGGLTWWNSHVKIVGIYDAHEMSQKDLMKLMIEVYYPRNEIQKLENELWNLIVKGNDVVVYTQRFQELDLLCLKMVLNEEEKIERRYVLLLLEMLTIKESGKMSRKEIIANNKTRGKKWVGYTLLELVTRQAML
ncbi:reverse transcriptase domain-containing protein [Tanacetum coccineum]|uniref:Reverse transcriptase domain-containing protein n=1 Tax=Tanacetum coccineum TaxID=301880 RepID=A0ABQ5I1M0_9ASTR